MAKSPGRTSKILAYVFVALGAFLITCALLLPTYTKSHALKTPLNLQVTAVATGTGQVLDASTLSAGAPRVDQNVPLKVQRHVTVQDPSNADIMTVEVGLTVNRTDRQGDAAVISAMVDRETVDRKTSEPVDNPIGSVQTEDGQPARPVKHVGLSYKWPFNVEKKTYQYFDPTTLTTHPINFVGQSEVNGMKAYHFHQVIPVTDLSVTNPNPTTSVTLPAKNFGLPGNKPVTMHQFFTGTRDVWVDPVTGTILNEKQQLDQFFGQNANDHALTALNGSVQLDEKTIEYQVGQAHDGQDKISMLTRIIPIIIGVVGAILLIVGLVLGFRANRRDRDGEKPEGEPTTVDTTVAPAAGGAAGGAWEEAEPNTEVFPPAQQAHPADETYRDDRDDDNPTGPVS